MPDVIRLATRMNCRGITLAHPLDRIPEDYYPYLQNTRVLVEGRIESRPGYTTFGAVAGAHSLRRLNDTAEFYAPTGYIYVAGGGTSLFGGIESALASIDTSFSGNPLSLISFRPEGSPSAFMYVYDEDKQVKVRPDATVFPIGTPPPQAVTDADYGTPANVDADTGQDATGWVASGSAGAVALTNRDTGVTQHGAGTLTIGAILYNSGTTGWCCIVPDSSFVDPFWMGPRMKIVIDGSETCLVREVHPNVPQLGAPITVAGVKYDSGATGLCTVVFNDPADGLARNSVLLIGAEYVRVLSVDYAPDGTTYSIRCSTTGTILVGDSVAGILSWYVYTVNNHAIGETLTADYLESTIAAGGPSTATLTKTGLMLDVSVADGRPISLADDYLHCSFYSNAPWNVAYVELIFGLGTDQYKWTVPADKLQIGWIELLLPISSAERLGDHPGQTFNTINELIINVVVNDACIFGFDWWYLFGTYGPFVEPNSPVGLLYASRNRDSTTGTASVPGPPTRHELFPLRENILVVPEATAAAEIDSLDIYRQGATLNDLTYVGTVVNNSGTPNTYNDELPDTSIASNPAADFDLIQPWPVEDLPWSGVVNVVGTTVTWVSGTVFNTDLLSGQVILINGVAYQVYGQPSSATQLQLFKSAGVQTSVPFLVSSPTIATQPLPLAFGPLEGPFAPVVFALGDPKNPGTLYFSNSANPDGASDRNKLEICAPSEPLITGAVWNGLAIVGSRENIYLVRYSFPQDAQQTPFQFQRIQSLSGMWSRWSICTGPDGIYFLGRDGIYRANESGCDIIGRVPGDNADPLTPLFPHDGNPAVGANGLGPVDMTALPSLRLSCCDQDIYFDYAAGEVTNNPFILDVSLLGGGDVLV